MSAILLALAPLLAGITEPLKNWFSYKQKEVEATREYTLAALKAQSEQAVAQSVAETSQLNNRLGVTSQSFKQLTWWFLSAIVVYSIVFPTQAVQMWKHFDLIPEWFRYLYLSVFGVIWGLPIAKDNISLMFESVKSLAADRREYKIEKLKTLNEAKIFESLRKSIFTKGLTQAQVDDVKAALRAGQEDV